MRTTFRVFLLSMSFVLCFSAAVFGQRTTGDVEGTVKDPQGAVVPGVGVTLTGVNVGFNRTIQSDDQGAYRFQQVPAGTYKIATNAVKGFGAYSAENVVVTLEQTTTADINLGVNSAVNTVDVSTDPLGVNVDTSDTKIQTNITSKLIEQLPKGTSFGSLLKVSPATRAEPLSGQYQIDGASGAENSFVIDGQEVTNFRTGTLNAVNNIPTALVQEIQVKSSGFEAEFGGASGGVISVQTKSGTDTYHGEFGTQIETSKLQPGNRFAPSVFQNSPTSPQYVFAVKSPRTQYTNMYPTATVSGPIIKRRLWFLGSFSPQIFETTQPTTFFNALDSSSFTNVGQSTSISSGVNLVPSTTFPTATYNSTTKYEYAFARVDAQVFNNLRFSSTFLYNPSIFEGNIPYGATAIGSTPNNARSFNGQTLNDVAFQQLGGGRTNSNNFTSQLVYTPTSNLVVTGRYAHQFLNEKGNAAYGIANVTRFICAGSSAGYTTTNTGCTRGFQNVSSNSLTTRDASIKNEVNADLTYSLSHFLGRHEFKGGYQYGTTKNDVLSGYAATGIVQLQYGLNFGSVGYPVANSNCNLGVTCAGVGRLIRFGTKGIASNRYQGLYIQDRWQPTSRLTLNLGVRAEQENLPAYNTGNGSGGQPLKFGFGSKIAPRLGAAYDVFGDGKSKIFASFGYFYDRLKFELPRGSFGGDFYRIDYFPISAANPTYSAYTPSTILGSFKDPIGGGNPSTSGGLSQFQVDYRIPSNLTAAQFAALGLPFAGVAPGIKPFRQSEITVGYEKELSRIYVLTARYTRKNVDHAIEDHAVIGVNDSENYYIGNPGEGFDLQQDKAAGYVKSLKPQRLYNALEITLNKRLSNNYFFNVNYTLSRLYGNYSGLASSDEPAAATGVGRASPGVTRYFDYIVNGFTFNGTPDNGDLATDRRHAFKAYGGYDFNWFGSKTNSTELSFFQQILQGTPQTTYIGVENSSIVFSKRGDLGRSPTYSQTDLSLSHRYNFGSDLRYSIVAEINVLNAFNQNAVILVNGYNRYATNNTVFFSDIDPNYDPNTQTPTNALNTLLNGGFKPAQADAVLAGPANQRSTLYGAPLFYQAARSVRFGFRFLF